MHVSKRILALTSLLAIGMPTPHSSLSAASPPEGIEVVEDFDLNRYLGLWYEVARLDNPFERGLEQVTAEYQLISDDSIRVINRGYHTEKGKWKESTARAQQNGEQGQGQLKVTFFWPFASGYYILDLDTENYEYALVTGDKKSYLWILSRSPELPQESVDRLVEKAKSLGFATDELIWVDHSDS